MPRFARVLDLPPRAIVCWNVAEGEQGSQKDVAHQVRLSLLHQSMLEYMAEGPPAGEVTDLLFDWVCWAAEPPAGARLEWVVPVVALPVELGLGTDPAR